MDLMTLLEKFEHHQMMKGRKDSAALLNKARAAIFMLCQHRDESKETIASHERQLNIAKATMDKLPRDANKRHIVPYVDMLWSWTDGGPIHLFPDWERREDSDSKWVVTDGTAIHDVGLCYFTLDAAGAARRAMGEDNGG